MSKNHVEQSRWLRSPVFWVWVLCIIVILVAVPIPWSPGPVFESFREKRVAKQRLRKCKWQFSWSGGSDKWWKSRRRQVWDCMWMRGEVLIGQERNWLGVERRCDEGDYEVKTTTWLLLCSSISFLTSAKYSSILTDLWGFLYFLLILGKFDFLKAVLSSHSIPWTWFGCQSLHKHTVLLSINFARIH